MEGNIKIAEQFLMRALRIAAYLLEQSAPFPTAYFVAQGLLAIAFYELDPFNTKLASQYLGYAESMCNNLGLTSSPVLLTTKYLLLCGFGELKGAERYAQALQNKEAAVEPFFPHIEEFYPKEDPSGELFYGFPVECLQSIGRIQMVWGTVTATLERHSNVPSLVQMLDCLEEEIEAILPPSTPSAREYKNNLFDERKTVSYSSPGLSTL